MHHCEKANMPYNNIVWILSIHGLMLSQKIDGEKEELGLWGDIFSAHIPIPIPTLGGSLPPM